MYSATIQFNAQNKFAMDSVLTEASDSRFHLNKHSHRFRRAAWLLLRVELAHTQKKAALLRRDDDGTDMLTGQPFSFTIYEA